MPPANKTILHVGKYYPPARGGMEYFLAALGKSLEKLGTRCVILAHNHKPTGEVADRTTTGNHDNEPSRIYRTPVLVTFAYTPISPSFPIWINRVLKQYKPDIIHIHMPNPSAFWLLNSPRARRIPWVIHWHSDVLPSVHDKWLKSLYRFYRPFEKRMLRRAKYVIATSKAYMDSSDALSSWHQKCHVIPLGIDPYNQQQTSSGDMKTANRLWNGAEARVLCIARLSYYKGLPDLLNAARYLRNTRIVIVGTGEQKNELHRLAEDEDITEKIAFVDECEEPLKAVLLDTCTCLCLPSIERTEAFGMALLEAMAHAKPTVICDIPGSGTGWVVQDGETGYIVPMQRPRELAHAIDKLTSDPSKARAMGQAGRQRLESEFSIHGVATRINEIYNRISQDAQEEL